MYLVTYEVIWQRVSIMIGYQGKRDERQGSTICERQLQLQRIWQIHRS